MEFLIGFGIYFAMVLLTVVPFTNSVYKTRLNLSISYHPSKFNTEEQIKTEIERRAILKKTAKRDGMWYAIFWFLILPIETVLVIFSLVNKGVNKSLEKHDKEFQNQLTYLQTEKILKEYNEKQKKQFEELVN